MGYNDDDEDEDDVYTDRKITTFLRCLEQACIYS